MNNASWFHNCFHNGRNKRFQIPKDGVISNYLNCTYLQGLCHSFKSTTLVSTKLTDISEEVSLAILNLLAAKRTKAPLKWESHSELRFRMTQSPRCLVPLPEIKDVVSQSGPLAILQPSHRLQFVSRCGVIWMAERVLLIISPPSVCRKERRRLTVTRFSFIHQLRQMNAFHFINNGSWLIKNNQATRPLNIPSLSS